MPVDGRPVNVLVCTSLTDELLAQIVAVDERAKVHDAAAQLLEELPSALRPGQTPAPLREPGSSLNDLLAEAEVLLSARRLPADVASRAPNVRWVQSPLAGVELFRQTDLWDAPEVTITSGAGINSGPVAEYVVAAIFSLAKNVPRMLASKARREWDRFELGPVRGTTLGIVGLGAVGGEVARLAQGLGMNVLATKRHVDPEAHLPSWVLPHDQLHRLLAASDFVVLAVPATGETVGMIGRAELEAMRPSACLINVSRGDVVDEAALIDALRRGRLAGAALDVFETEPLPAVSPLWDLPNVVISGHIAGLFESYDARVVDLFVANLRLYLDGYRLVNAVDRDAGY
ncbi:MAG: D-2-hydroxyacid dehydrogenase [Chloroflexi bacterium]|nr:D-2-hydroxyacid dehydrogenase [Chloroflexota bacterium]